MICLEESFCQSINMLAIQQYFPLFRLPQTNVCCVLNIGSERSKVIKQEEVKKKVKEAGRLLKFKSGLSYWCNSRNCAKPRGLGWVCFVCFSEWALGKGKTIHVIRVRCQNWVEKITYFDLKLKPLIRLCFHFANFSKRPTY